MTDSPPRCGPLAHHWPWPLALPGAQLVSAPFMAERLDNAAFTSAGIALPEGLEAAAPKRRAEFLAGRLCARQALWHLDGRWQAPAMGEDKAPLWPAGCIGSITHSHGWAAALVGPRASYQGLGLDAERWLDDETAARLARRVLTPAERERLPANEAALAVTLTFSLKESLFKALYPLVGRRFYFPDAELIDWHPQGSARLRLLSDLSPAWPAGRELDGSFCRWQGRLLSLVAIPAP
ncbi:4'-phosphopantetheinyl transferase family protein [Halomonas salifodinae]|uniref:4'-phosphopantetheinyl transferase family protein n=1 Tax=Halomonas salifodinae TaxID=438745 RepID=UPI0033AA617A